MDTHLKEFNEYLLEQCNTDKKSKARSEAYDKLLDIYEPRLFKNYLWRKHNVGTYTRIPHGERVDFNYATTEANVSN